MEVDRTENAQILVIMNELQNIKTLIQEIRKDIDAGKTSYASLERVQRLEDFVYKGIWFIVAAFLAGLTALIWKN